MELKTYSLGGEDIILEHIFNIIGEGKFFIDVGSMDGYRHSNTRRFINKDWKGLCLDKGYSGYKPEDKVKIEFITAENINDLFKKHNVPEQVDLLDIDIDGNDYWVWKAITINPRVVIIEYNPNLEGKKAVKYNPDFIYDGTRCYGASFEAMIDLGKQKGYTALYEVDINNIIFVRDDLLKPEMKFDRFHISHFLPEDEIDFLPHICHLEDTLKREFIEV